MVNTELYIIVNGERKKLDLPSPSGITLNFVSNLFNDLSKINASYSYTFKLPRTANNVRMLELADDVRADGKFTKVKNEAEFVYDGVSLFANANMYISGVEDDTISAVLTWNVNKGLQELSKHDMSLNELGNHLPEGEYDYVGDEASDYEKDKVVLIGNGIYDAPSEIPVNLRPYLYSHSLLRPDFAKYADYNPTQPYFRSLHNGGTPPYRVTREFSYSSQGIMRFMNTYPLYENASDGKLSPMKFVCSDEEIELKKIPYYNEGGDKLYVDSDNKCHYPVFPLPTPIIPVPYLFSVIEKVFGVNFDLSGDLYNSLCLPLVKTDMSDGLARRNYIRLCFGEEASYLCLTSAVIYLNTPNVNTISNAQIQSMEMYYSSHFTVPNIVTCDTVIDSYSKLKILVSGKIVVKVRAAGGIRYYDDKKKATLTFWCQTYESGKNFYKVGSVYASKVVWHSVNDGDSYEEITFNCNPGEGFEIFESETLYRPSIAVTLTYGEPNDTPDNVPNDRYDVLEVTGEFRLSFKASDYPMNCYINLFQNLPDISCLDFVKAIFYALGGYPYQGADGKIKLQQYKGLIQRINSNDLYNWQNKSLSSIGSQAENFEYNAHTVTDLTLGQKNYYLMKNDSVDDYGKEEENNKLEDAYEHGYECIEIDSDMLDRVQTVFTFPFQGGFLWQKGYYSMRDYHHTIPLATNRIDGINGVETYEGDLTLINLIGQDRWVIADEGYDGSTSFRNPRYKSQEAKPILGVVQPIRVPVAAFTQISQGGALDPENPDVSVGGVTNYYHIVYQNENTQYLSMRSWNCATDLPKINGRDLLQALLGNSCLVKETMNLNVMDLATLDIEKPVYLEQYNSFFAIKKIEVSPEGVSKVELIRIPSEILNESVPNSETEE